MSSPENTQPTGRTYRISTLGDILQIPEETGERARFLADLPDALRKAEAGLAMSKDKGYTFGVTTWTDDGSSGTAVRSPKGEVIL